MNERLGTLIEGYRTNTWLIRRHAEGLTDEGCLRQPAFEVITFNWVLGHIVGHRDHALVALGAAPVWADPPAVYGEDPAVLTALDVGRTLAELLADLDMAEGRLADAMESVSEPLLTEIVDSPFGKVTRLERVAGLQWHETYHVGQLGLLKSVAKG